MEKRTDKNKDLYQKVNQQIAEIAKKKSNEEFKLTENTLKEINPQLFADQDLIEEEKKEETHKINVKLLLSIAFTIIIVLIILIVVVSLNGKK